MPELRDWLQRAQQENFAIGAFNVANLETLKAIVNAAQKLRSPVIIEASPGESSFMGIPQLMALIDVYRDETNLPIFLNLDHAVEVEPATDAIRAGFDLIHFDGSTLPYEENIAKTKEVVALAHAQQLLVEGEMDHIQGSSADHRSESLKDVVDSSLYTDPEKAQAFVQETHIDIFAAFFGNVHGVYQDQPQLDIERIKKISERLTCFLSLHGGSGIPDDQVRAAIQSANIVKVNVNSEMRIAFRDTLRERLNTSDEVATYKIMPEVIEAVQQVVETKINVFGSAGTVL
jgi:ketose-bisphosphate aldolase